MDRVVQMDMPPLVIPPRTKKHGGARIYDAPAGGAKIYEVPEPIRLSSLNLQLDLPIPAPQAEPAVAVDLTIPANPS